jgi:hypothetical protein
LTVYVVMEWDYDGVTIYGVFSSREKAEAYIAAKPRARKRCEVEEYDLDVET